GRCPVKSPSGNTSGARQPHTRSLRMNSRAGLSAVPLAELPEVRPGDDLALLIAEAWQRSSPATGELEESDLLVVAHKVVSKAEGRIRRLVEIEPGQRASALAREFGKDPRHVQAVLDESAALLRAARGVIVCVTRHGFVCANAGVDASNVADH